ncbi:alpha/beta fold hydrolase [Pelagibacterium halotolerans]|uniref:Putative hydrolase n=1 Tax=Pelagibacterium halotolerans (strain DSM 22347 / JCM 15775 / CGMCC 1.7692 / B2) TaxID=1082931 RepID=G4R9A2_PELHB|nr:alpha/beta hydrolase [Pelagibacterium halotolerans]AEQ53436.1 putative hydrolase [Pelagibacterium halotolerans B2]QJR20382.1 alpha/beta hydrolase [Pelagibacterium halotolerans]SEA60394.1 Pimeloyl-ACP methyl ester carboxylesterase [Pelagibacterium halotolerans]
MPKVKSADGSAIGYETHGTGPLVIVVAGATQYRAVDTDTPKLADILARRFTVVLYDRRGRGGSGNTEPYAVNREIEDIEALIDALGGSAMLYGMSSGAVLALEAAASLPRKVTRVICYEPPINTAQSKDDAFSDLAEMEAYKARGDGAGAMEAFMLSVGTPPEHVEGFKQSPQWAAYAAVGTTIAHDFRILAEATKTDMKARWRGIAQPVLVVNGDQSFDFMAAAADTAAASLPSATRKTLPGQGHGPAPDSVAPVIIEFFS